MSQPVRNFGVLSGYQARSLRACMVCSVIRPHAEFQKEGCPNCEEALQMAGSSDIVGECTSSNFNGIIALMDTKNSWVARYHRLEGYKPGMYAVQVIGNLSEDYVDTVRAAGLRFVRRDGRKEEDEQAE
jgi:transcription elongation factor SPT4